MSARTPRLPRAALAALAVSFAVACGGGGGGGGGGADSPRVDSITPSSGYSGNQVPVVIRGANFLVSPQSATIRAWLGTTELLDDQGNPGGVKRIDVNTLEATVPAGMEAGVKTLTVENAYGKRGSLTKAFAVESLSRGALAVTIDALAASGSVGQSFTLRATISNVGSGVVTGIRPTVAATSTDGAAATTTGPTPGTIDQLAPGESAAVSSTVVLTAAGHLVLTVSGAGSDSFSGLEVAVPASHAAILVQQPAGLVATIAASRATVNTGQSITVTLTVTNGSGQANAIVTQLTRVNGSATCGVVTPAVSATSPVTVPAGEARSFAWTCSSAAAGGLSFSATASGEDANAGTPVSATPALPALVTVQTPAALSAALAVDGNPATASFGQTLTFRFTIHNTGGASANVAQVTMAATAGAAACDTPAPATPQAVDGGDSVVFTWTCKPASVGALNLRASANAADGNTGAALSASATLAAPITVQLPPALLATVSANPTHPVDVGQAITISFTVGNGGSVRANGVVVTPTFGGTAQATCDAAVAPGATNIDPNGGVQIYTWHCSPTAAGSLTFSGTATGTDANSGDPVTATASATSPITVQTPADLGAGISVEGSPTTVSVGQTLTAHLVVSDTGGASASVTAITPSPTGICTSPSPSPPATATPGAPVSFSWTCTPSTPGSLTLGASVTGTDVNNGAALSASASLATPITVQTAAALAAGLATDRSQVDTNQSVAVTLTISNGGETPATVSNVTRSIGGVAGSCTAPSATSFTVPGNGSYTVTWTCTPTGAGTASLGATVTASGTASPSVTPASVSVQAPAAMTSAGLAATPTTVAVGSSTAVTLTINNNNASGGASAQVTTVTPSSTGDHMSCPTVPDETLPVTIAGGSSALFHWSCSGVSAGGATLGATVAGHDVNDPSRTFGPTPAGVGMTVQTAAALAAGLATDRSQVDTNQSVAVTLTISNGGETPATVSNVTRSIGGVAGSCTAPSATSFTVPGNGSYTVTWTCTPTGAGTASLGATVTASGTASPSVTPASVSVQAPAAMTSAGIGASATTVGVGAAIAVTLTVNNNNDVGGANALVTSVTPSSSTGAVTCPTAPTETLPVTVPAGGSAAVHWTCTGAAAGDATIGATVAGHDVNDPGLTFAPAPAGVSVTVARAALTASLGALPTATSPGSDVTVTLTVNNTAPSGGGTAHVSSVTRGMSGVTGSCSAPSATSFDLAAQGSREVTWTCTPTTLGTASLSAVVTAIDLGSSASISPTVAPLDVAVGGSTALSTSDLVADRATINVGQSVGLTLTLRNQGGTLVHVTGIAGTLNGATTLCTTPSATAVDLAANGGNQSVTWSCSPNAAQPSASLDVTLTATEAGTGTDVTPALAPQTLTVNDPPLTVVSFSAAPTSLPVGSGTVAFALTLRNGTSATARLSAIDVAVDPTNAAGLSCTGPTVAPQDMTVGTPLDFAWSCAYTNPDGLTGAASVVSTTVTATDELSGASVAPTLADVTVTLQ